MATTTTTYTASAEMWMDEGPLRWRGVTRDAGGRIVGECFHLHRTEGAGLACASVCARAWTRDAVAEVEAAPYECPECGAGHDGATTGTEWCPACTQDVGGN